MQQKVYCTFILLLFSFSALQAQSYYSSGPRIFHGQQQHTYDTIDVSGLVPQTLDGTFGLDSITFDIAYDYDMDLVLTLISPDGKQVRIAENLGWDNDSFTHTCITMSVNTLINNVGAPFTGQMRPEGWLGAVNDGQNGNGKWMFHIYNMTNSNDSGILLNWALHFSNTPAPPSFFDSSSLPIVVVNTDNDLPIPFYSDDRVNGTMGIIHNGPNNTNHIGDAFNNYNGKITIKVRGNSTRYFAQKAYSFSTVDASYQDSNVALIDMPAESDWILYAPFDDKTLVRNVLCYQLSNEMGDYASRTRMCELVLNGDYRGVYVMEEKIKRDANRVDIAKLNPQDTTGSQLTGGYIFEVDRPGIPGYNHWNSNYLPCDSAASLISFVYSYPNEDKINTPQKNYIARYVDSFETALKTLPLNDSNVGYRHYIDIPSFIDFSLQQELGKNVDGYRLSSYCYKKKDGKLFAGPIWDFNEAYGNADYYDGIYTYGFEWDFPCPFGDPGLNPFWWKAFTTDTAYMHQLQCRYSNLRYSGIFDTLHIYSVIDSLTTLLAIPELRHFERWPIMGVYVWPNAYVGTTYADDVAFMKTWISHRLHWLDNQWYNPSCIDTATNPTATSQLNFKPAVSIYPNPANDVLNVSVLGAVNTVAIYNIMGQKLYEQPVRQRQFSIPLKQYGFSSGVYNMILTSSQGILRRSFIVDTN